MDSRLSSESKFEFSHSNFSIEGSTYPQSNSRGHCRQSLGYQNYPDVNVPLEINNGGVIADGFIEQAKCNSTMDTAVCYPEFSERTLKVYSRYISMCSDATWFDPGFEELRDRILERAENPSEECTDELLNTAQADVDAAV